MSDPELISHSAEDVRELEYLADVFALLGDRNRLRILVSLQRGKLRVGDISEATGMSQSATSHALRLLRAHHIVSVEREGRVANYSIADEHVHSLLTLGLDHIGHSADVEGPDLH